MKRYLIPVLAIAAVIVLAISIWPGATKMDLLAFPAEGRLIKYDAALTASGPLAGDALTSFHEVFLSAPYFAAFTVGTDGRYGWASGRHSLENARLDALGFCGVPLDCTVVYEIAPHNAGTPITDATTASWAMSQYAASLDLATVKERYFAMSSNGSWAFQSPGENLWFAPLLVKGRCLFHTVQSRPFAPCYLFKGKVILPANLD